jgi:uncharacterized membrane protein HdeD (DUF308 family)
MRNVFNIGRYAIEMESLEELRKRSIWLFILGILLIVLGVVAFTSVGLATLASILVFGWLLIIGGVAQVAEAVRSRDWKGSSIGYTLLGILYFIAGVFTIRNPVAGAVGATLAIALLYFAAGVFRTFFAASVRLPNWGWRLATGLIDVFLASIIIASWPGSSIWVLGTLVAVDLVCAGWADIMLATAVHEVAAEGRPATAM